MPGRARRVHHHADIVVRQRNRRRGGAGSGERAFVVAVGPVVVDLEQGLRQRGGLCRKRLVVDQLRTSPRMYSSSGTVSRQFRGSMIAPSRPQASWISKYSAQVGAEGHPVAPGRCRGHGMKR